MFQPLACSIQLVRTYKPSCSGRMVHCISKAVLAAYLHFMRASLRFTCIFHPTVGQPPLRLVRSCGSVPVDACNAGHTTRTSHPHAHTHAYRITHCLCSGQNDCGSRRWNYATQSNKAFSAPWAFLPVPLSFHRRLQWGASGASVVNIAHTLPMCMS